MKIIIFLGLFGFSTIAGAIRYHNGEAFETGTVVDRYVCTVNGIWQRI